ncbi:hypothetical protein PVK06_011458 [Gossypium arboreum]|uniref:Uncharacterized protein n=1 Tax=Gossypium arboreum TaxID=29729 RepID=A0ABR0Q910_GOSAR|nr:hypothetical protein PVK06_011458 [Gossypium arboreum]
MHVTDPVEVLRAEHVWPCVQEESTSARVNNGANNVADNAGSTDSSSFSNTLMHRMDLYSMMDSLCGSGEATTQRKRASSCDRNRPQAKEKS